VTGTLSRFGIPLLAALGLADSAYLSVLHFQGEIPPCGGYAGCQTVNSSPYAEIFGVPIALFGAALSIAILAAALYRARGDAKSWLPSTVAIYTLALAGAVFMAYLLGIELLVLRAVCYWCLAMTAFIAAMLVLAMRDFWAYSASSPV
jgi:uncharacterized membrane protein